MPVNQNDVGESAFQKASASNANPYGQSRRGPSALPRTENEVGEWVVASELGTLGPTNGAPSHRKPGAQKKAVPENSTSRTDAAHLS